MDFLMILLLILTVGTLNVACFFIGAKVGQTVVKGETIETPSINPAKTIREHKSNKITKAEQARIETVLRNIDNYNGTCLGQEEVPMG